MIVWLIAATLQSIIGSFTDESRLWRDSSISGADVQFEGLSSSNRQSFIVEPLVQVDRGCLGVDAEAVVNIAVHDRVHHLVAISTC